MGLNLINLWNRFSSITQKVDRLDFLNANTPNNIFSLFIPHIRERKINNWFMIDPQKGLKSVPVVPSAHICSHRYASACALHALTKPRVYRQIVGREQDDLYLWWEYGWILCVTLNLKKFKSFMPAKALFCVYA